MKNKKLLPLWVFLTTIILVVLISFWMWFDEIQKLKPIINFLIFLGFTFLVFTAGIIWEKMKK